MSEDYQNEKKNKIQKSEKKQPLLHGFKSSND